MKRLQATLCAAGLLALLLRAPAGSPSPRERFRPDDDLPPEAGLPYVIITTEELAPHFKPLADWKRRTGLPAQVVTVEWISANPHYAGIDLPEQLHRFLQDLALNWRTRWVLLGGDVEAVPEQKIRARSGQYGGDAVSCDIYYADVLPGTKAAEWEAVEAYDWNSNGDRHVGDAQKDRMDLECDLHVGRIPVANGAEAAVFLEKYLEYVDPKGKDLSHLARALIVGANEFKAAQTTLKDQIQRMGGEGYTASLLVEGTPDPAEAIVKELCKGQGILDFYCHGNPGGFWAADDHRSFTRGHIGGLRNAGRYGIVYANSCSTNDFSKDDCLGESFLLQPKGGAVAYLGYTEVCFGAPVRGAFYRHLFGGSCPEIGRALAAAKADERFSTWPGQVLNLLGDPEMWVWTGAARKVEARDVRLSASLPGRVTVVDGAGRPCPYARVRVDGAGAFLAGMTDAEGIVRLPPPPKPGTAELSIVAQNAVRAVSRVRIGTDPIAGYGKPVPRPALEIDDAADGDVLPPEALKRYAPAEGEEPVSAEDPPAQESIVLRGNNQKDLNPGERLRLHFELPAGASFPEGACADLSFEGDPYVRCLNAPQRAEGGRLSFVVEVSRRTPPWRQIWCTLSLSERGGQDPWRWTYAVPMDGPNPSCVACAVDDAAGNKDGRIGWEDAGKRIRFTLGIFNRGTRDARSLRGSVSTKDPAVRILKDAAAFGNVPPQDLVARKDPFEIELADGYDGHPIELSLSMEDARGSRWEGTLLFTVPPPPPILVRTDASARSVTVSWTASGSGAVAGYHVYRASSERGTLARLTEQPVRNRTSFRDLKVRPGGSYFYAVRAVTPEGLESAPSALARAFTLTPLPRPAGGGTK